MDKWSKPYYGVSHLDGVRDGFQITVTDRGLFAECSIKVPGCREWRESMHDDAAQAQQHGEIVADSLDARAKAESTN